VKSNPISVLIGLFFLTASQPIIAQTDAIGGNLTDSLLINYLQSNYYPTNSKNYDTARDFMYGSIDVQNDSVRCVYTGLLAFSDGTTRTPTSDGGLSFNTEHSWPQSFYDSNEPMRGDIHHLFPVWSSVNSSRNNNPFAEIPDELTTSWWYWENGTSVSEIPSENKDAYSEYYNNLFEPREDHKGNLARAMFYFWTMYYDNAYVVADDNDNQAFFDGMKSTLYSWHILDPVDANEVSRSLAAEGVQGNRNPFIHDTTLVRRAYFSSGSGSGEQSTDDLYISEVYEANGGVVKYVELFNNTGVDINLDSGDWELWRFSNAGTTGTRLDLTGTIAAKDFFVIGDDDPNFGVQSLFGQGIVDLDKGSAISHNGNDKYLLIKNASSIPDTVDAFAGDNIGNSSNFALNQVVYRVASELPNNGDFGQTSNASDGALSASGYWRSYNVSSSNLNGLLVGSPGYNSGIESTLHAQIMIRGSAGWRLLSLPITNATVSDFSDNTAIQGVNGGTNAGSSPNFYVYNNNGSWSIPSDVNTSWGDGYGVAVYFFNNSNGGSTNLPILLDVEGDTLDGDVTIDLNPNNTGFTLVGNPHSASIDLNELVASGNGISNFVSLWDNSSGNYTLLDISSTAIIRPWQAFWVQSIGGATQLTIPLSSKTYQSPSTHKFKNVQNTSVVKIPFTLKSENTDYVSFSDRALQLILSDDSIIGLDRNDFVKSPPLNDEYLAGAFWIDTLRHASFSLPAKVSKPQTINLEISNHTPSTSLSLSWEHMNSIDETLNVFLIDSFLGTSLDMKAVDRYSFSVDSNTVLDQRFHIKFVPNTGVMTESIDEADSFTLDQNYPNPFNPSTTIRYSVEEAGNYTLELFDSSGRLIETLVDEFKTTGRYSFYLDAQFLPSGTYFYRLSSSTNSITRSLTLLK